MSLELETRFAIQSRPRVSTMRVESIIFPLSGSGLTLSGRLRISSAPARRIS